MHKACVLGKGFVTGCDIHHPNCTPSFDFLPFLSGADEFMDQEGINGESSMYAIDSGRPTGYEHPTGSHEVIDGGLISMPPVGAPYTLNPSTGADHHAYYGVGKCLYESFDNASNASYVAPALPTINTHFTHAGNIFPSPNSASTDTTVYTNTTELHLVGSYAMRTVSTGRKKKDPIFVCPFQDCSATFTAKHNYQCPYFLTGNISSN
jgi:hypothetical protein